MLGSYAFLADGERGALIGPRGDIAWMCAPGWDSDAVFTSLIGGDSFYAVTPTERFTWGGYYEAASLIWRSRWVTTAGVIECREALAFPGSSDRAVILRQVRSPEAAQQVDIHLAPTAGFDRDPLSDRAPPWPDLDWEAWSAVLALARSRRGPCSLRRRRGGHQLDARATVSPDETLDLVLELSLHPLDDDVPDPAKAWRATEEAWKSRRPTLSDTLDPKGAALAYAVMRGLTSSGGGMVAAATTSLPERAEQGRNYDYRYVWIRDQAYAGQAVAAAGGGELLDSATRFITARLLDDGPMMAPAYRTDGTAVPDQRRIDLAGYPGGFDLVGNHVNRQFQLDAFGEALLLLAAAGSLDRLDLDGQQAAQVAADAIAKRWQDADAGIWEIDDRAWTHSRLICAAGLRRAAAVLAPSSGPAGPQWSLLADQIVAATATTSLHPAGYWQRSPEDPGLDGALLLPAIRGAVPAEDPRSAATVAAVIEQLSEDGYAYRFRHDDLPLAEAEGASCCAGS